MADDDRVRVAERSHGERSFFSLLAIVLEVVAVAGIAEFAGQWLLFRRPAQFALYLFGLLVSVSGTGWSVLCVFVVELAFVTGALDVFRTLVLTGAGVLAVTLASLIVPDIISVLTERAGELAVQSCQTLQNNCSSHFLSVRRTVLMIMRRYARAVAGEAKMHTRSLVTIARERRMIVRPRRYSRPAASRE